MAGTEEIRCDGRIQSDTTSVAHAEDDRKYAERHKSCGNGPQREGARDRESQQREQF